MSATDADNAHGDDDDDGDGVDNKNDADDDDDGDNDAVRVCVHIGCASLRVYPESLFLSYFKMGR